MAGSPLPRYLDSYYDGLWSVRLATKQGLSAFNAFEFDFVVKNVIPNVSGLVFKRPQLTTVEMERLFQYKFAGDWYFYALSFGGAR